MSIFEAGGHTVEVTKTRVCEEGGLTPEEEKRLAKLRKDVQLAKEPRAKFESASEKVITGISNDHFSDAKIEETREGNYALTQQHTIRK